MRACWSPPVWHRGVQGLCDRDSKLYAAVRCCNRASEGSRRPTLHIYTCTSRVKRQLATCSTSTAAGPLAGALRRAAYLYKQPTDEHRLRVRATVAVATALLSSGKVIALALFVMISSAGCICCLRMRCKRLGHAPSLQGSAWARCALGRLSHCSHTLPSVVRQHGVEHVLQVGAAWLEQLARDGAGAAQRVLSGKPPFSASA